MIRDPKNPVVPVSGTKLILSYRMEWNWGGFRSLGMPLPKRTRLQNDPQGKFTNTASKNGFLNRKSRLV